MPGIAAGSAASVISTIHIDSAVTYDDHGCTFLAHDRRRVVHYNVIAHPTGRVDGAATAGSVSVRSGASVSAPRPGCAGRLARVAYVAYKVNRLTMIF